MFGMSRMIDQYIEDFHMGLGHRAAELARDPNTDVRQRRRRMEHQGRNIDHSETHISNGSFKYEESVTIMRGGGGGMQSTSAGFAQPYNVADKKRSRSRIEELPSRGGYPAALPSSGQRPSSSKRPSSRNQSGSQFNQDPNLLTSELPKFQSRHELVPSYPQVYNDYKNPSLPEDRYYPDSDEENELYDNAGAMVPYSGKGKEKKRSGSRIRSRASSRASSSHGEQHHQTYPEWPPGGYLPQAERPSSRASSRSQSRAYY